MRLSLSHSRWLEGNGLILSLSQELLYRLSAGFIAKVGKQSKTVQHISLGLVDHARLPLTDEKWLSAWSLLRLWACHLLTVPSAELRSRKSPLGETPGLPE